VARTATAAADRSQTRMPTKVVCGCQHLCPSQTRKRQATRGADRSRGARAGADHGHGHGAHTEAGRRAPVPGGLVVRLRANDARPMASHDDATHTHGTQRFARIAGVLRTAPDSLVQQHAKHLNTNCESWTY
jgi:hypothetical protein